MSDPRFTDPYDRNSQLSDPVLRRDRSVDGSGAGSPALPWSC